MDNKKANVSIGSFSTALIFGILGYFVYGGFNGFLSMFLMYLCLSVLILMGIIPIIGQILYYLVLGPWFVNGLIKLTGIHPSWLTSLAYYWTGFMTCILSLGLICIAIAKGKIE